MEEARKNAYRYLLYWAMLDIRVLAWLKIRWWNPITWRNGLRYMRRAGRLADCLHNLGLYASIDFKNFNEEWFWRDFESFASGVDESRYRELFKMRLEELQSKSA